MPRLAEQRRYAFVQQELLRWEVNIPIQAISNDLKKPGRSHPDLFDTIKGIGTGWWHCAEHLAQGCARAVSGRQ
jgi:hypothetical protein